MKCLFLKRVSWVLLGAGLCLLPSCRGEPDGRQPEDPEALPWISPAPATWDLWPEEDPGFVFTRYQMQLWVPRASGWTEATFNTDLQHRHGWRLYRLGIYRAYQVLGRENLVMEFLDRICRALASLDAEHVGRQFAQERIGREDALTETAAQFVGGTRPATNPSGGQLYVRIDLSANGQHLGCVVQVGRLEKDDPDYWTTSELASPKENAIRSRLAAHLRSSGWELNVEGVGGRRFPSAALGKRTDRRILLNRTPAGLFPGFWERDGTYHLFGSPGLGLIEDMSFEESRGLPEQRSGKRSVVVLRSVADRVLMR